MSNYSAEWRLTLLACVGFLASCASVPQLGESPDTSGLVIVETDITSGSFIGTVNVGGRVKIASLANPQVEVVGKPYKSTNYHVFAGLTPGAYRLVAAAYSVGNTSTILGLGDSMSKILRGTFEVQPGEPHYVGKLRIALKVEGVVPKMTRNVALEYSPSEEKMAWEALSAEPGYANSPWFSKIRQRAAQAAK